MSSSFGRGQAGSLFCVCPLKCHKHRRWKKEKMNVSKSRITTLKKSEAALCEFSKAGERKPFNLYPSMKQVSKFWLIINYCNLQH